MSDFERYNCQITLPGFGEQAQERLQNAKVLIVGAGGLGCPAAQYLAAAGIGTIGIADDDIVSISNLHRQILYTPQDAGKSKAAIACERLQLQNPGIKLIPRQLKVNAENVIELIANYDLIIDCTDNFEARYLLNDAAVISQKPLIYGAIYQFEGQVAVWNVQNKDGSFSPNYRDVFPEVNASQIPNCTEGGVIPTLAGIIGCMQANEVIKLITQTGDLLAGKMLIFDAQTLQRRIMKLGSVTKINITSIVNGATFEQITLNEFCNIDNAVLVDVRTLRERDLDDVGGLHIPLDELDENLDLFEPGKIYGFYCVSGNRSMQAVKLINERKPGVKAVSVKG